MSDNSWGVCREGESPDEVKFYEDDVHLAQWGTTGFWTREGVPSSRLLEGFHFNDRRFLEGAWAVLVQEVDEVKCSNACASCQISETELKCLDVVQAVCHFRCYLYVRQFTVVLYCKSLRFLKTSRNTSSPKGIYPSGSITLRLFIEPASSTKTLNPSTARQHDSCWNFGPC